MSNENKSQKRWYEKIFNQISKVVQVFFNSIRELKERKKLGEPLQGQGKIRAYAFVFLLAVYSLGGMILLSFVFNPSWWSWPFLFLPGAAVFFAHVASTYKETLEKNVRARTMFGRCSGWQEEGPGFLIPFIEKFVPPIMEGTEGGATFHTKIFAVQLYSEQFRPREKRQGEETVSYNISTLELADLLGVGVDAMFWFQIAKHAETKEERFDAYYKAVFIGGKQLTTRLKSAAEAHTRTIYGSIKVKEAISLNGKNLWNRDEFRVAKEDTQDAFKDVGVDIMDNKGMVIEALGIPEILEKASQKKKQDELDGEGDYLRFGKGVRRNIEGLKKLGLSPEKAAEIVIAEEQINSLPNLAGKGVKFIIGGYPGQLNPEKRKNNSNLIPQAVIDVSKEEDENSDHSVPDNV